MVRLTHLWAVGLVLASCDVDDPDAGAAPSTDAGGKSDVFGSEDDRVEVLDEPRWAASSEAVALLAPSTKFSERSPGVWRLRWTPHAQLLAGQAGGTICSDVQFLEQSSVGSACTAFMVDEDVAVTAGHCVETPFGTDACPHKMLAFGYRVEESDDPVDTTLRPAEQIFRCVETLDYRNRFGSHPESGEDWAIIRVEPVVPGSQTVALSLSDEMPTHNTSVAMLGHPTGLPMKLTPGRSVGDPQEGLIFAELDIFGGNSGSPLLDDAGDLVGVVSAGEIGHFERTSAGCFIHRACDVAVAPGQVAFPGVEACSATQIQSIQVDAFSDALSRAMQ